MFVLLCSVATGGGDRGGAGLPAEEFKIKQSKKSYFLCLSQPFSEISQSIIHLNH